MAIEQFNTNEVRMIVWVKRGDLEDWISGGFIEPSDFEEAACGKRYLWSREDIYRLAAFKRLVESGLGLIDAYEALEVLPTKEIKDDNMIKIKHEVDERIKQVFG